MWDLTLRSLPPRPPAPPHQGKKEVERVVASDPDPLQGYVLLIDQKWDQADMKCLYCEEEALNLPDDGRRVSLSPLPVPNPLPLSRWRIIY